MVGRPLSFWEGKFSGPILNYGGVIAMAISISGSHAVLV